MTDEDDRNIMIVNPWDWPHMPASVEITATCGHQAALGPASKKIMEESDASGGVPFETICIRCLPPEQVMAIINGEQQLAVLPGIKQEIVEYLGDEETEEMFNQFDIKETAPLRLKKEEGNGEGEQ